MQSAVVGVRADTPRATPRVASIAAGCLLAAGAYHLAVAPLHWAHAPAHGLFLVLAGLAEVAWGAACLRHPSASLYRTGAVMAGGSITLYAITRVLPAPFGHGPEEVDLLGLACKVAEGVGMAALVALLLSRSVSRALAPGAWRTGGLLVVAAFTGGWLLYGAASAAEAMLDEVSVPVAHQHASHVEPGDPDRLQLVVAGIPSPFASGGEVPLAGDLVAQLTVEPGEVRHSRRLDVRLHRTSGLEAVEGATILATGHMRYMDHGTFRQVAQPAGEGHYLLLLPFAMPGEWQLDLEIATPAERATVQLNLDLLE